MSEKDSVNRRGFFESLLPQKSRQANEPVSDEQGSSPASSTDRRGFISTSVVGVGLLYSQLAEAGRFDILELIDPTKPKNFAKDQDPYSALPKTDMQPYLWPSDDVRDKDRNPKTKMDIPSPSVAFETMKRLQFIVNNRFKEINARLKCLGYISGVADNFKHAIEPQHHLHEKHKKWKAVYDAEFPVNESLKKQWEDIDNRMEPLRKLIKEAVVFEAQACASQKRCAVGLGDIDPNDLFQAIPIEILPDNLDMNNMPNYNTYKDVNLPSQFKLEPFRCAKIDLTLASGSAEGITNSQMFECAKFLKRTVEAHIEASGEREKDYAQTEKYSTEIEDQQVITALRKIYTEGRKFNDNVRKKWDTILAEVIKVKALIAKAEFEETKAAGINGINRCAKK